MKIGIPKEIDDPRVAMVPAVALKLKEIGVEILMENDAGKSASFRMEDYGPSTTFVDRNEVFQSSDIILSFNPLPDGDLKSIKEGTILVSQFKPYFDSEIVGKLESHQLKAFSLDMVPRTTLAQTMDVLSSLASVAGYKAVLLAAAHLPRYFPMMITAAGSIRPAKVLVLGAGVAGLQAIATAKRMGAQVEASDTRLAAKEEVESLGAKFILVEGASDDTSAGGYAVEQSEDFLNRQRQEVQNRAAKSDVIITTAQVRGKKAPILLPKSTVDQMQPGSVIVDLAASTGGNCELTHDRRVVHHNGVSIIGDSDLSATMPQDASLLFANNVFNFLKLIIKNGNLHLDFENEIVKASFITPNV